MVATERRGHQPGGPMLTLRINGTEHQLDLDPAMPLLWAIREHIGLTGTKYGCGIAQCGTCTVFLNGAPVRSCSTPVSLAAGGKVMTIEGLDTGLGGLARRARRCAPPGRSWTWSSAASASPARSCPPRPCWPRTRSPTDADIDAALSGNLCRCATYARIRAAITGGRRAWPEEGHDHGTDSIENLSRRALPQGRARRRGRADSRSAPRPRHRAEDAGGRTRNRRRGQSAPRRPSSPTPSCASARTTP